MEALLHVNALSHSFDYPLFSNLSFTLEKKRSMAITGVSGSGKSTLLHICSTLLKPNGGEVFINGRDIYKLPNDELVNIRRNDIGIIFQSHFLFKGFDVKENIELATVLTNSDFDEELIRRLGISHVLNNKIGDISGGQQQRVSLARILCKKPKIIFADEPTGNLDQKTADEVINIIYEYIEKNDAALFLVTHDLKLADKCDIVYRLEN
ncbi:MAG: ABC transporter ATP-binding protein [Campylobacteraceae bacterium]|jgi:putative ABC transport system ATP-binding protein|nr:ABC transporter ATP-binding protein [Campylobacteraceae bacterium]